MRFGVLSLLAFRLLYHPDGDGGAGGAGGQQGGSSGQGGTGGQGGAGQGGTGGQGGDRTFTRDELNGHIAAEKRKLQEGHLKEIQELQRNQNLTKEERDRLKGREAELEGALYSEKDKAAREIQRKQVEFEDAQKKIGVERDQWKTQFERTVIENEILTVAGAEKAYNASQIASIVGPLAVVEEIKDGALKPTGKYRAVVRVVEEVDGKSEAKTYSVAEYVKKLKAMDSYQNLFLADRPGGTGHRPGSGKAGATGANLTSAQKIAEGLRAIR
jgi:hypothetical protein